VLGLGCCFAQQTLTTVDQNGQSIVEVVSTNNGAATTQIISTITPDQQQGPVGQPGQQVTGTGPTPYTYTTVINSVSTAVLDTFTPTFPATQPPSIGPSGTKWNYDDWSSIYATQTGNSGTNRRPLGLAVRSLILSTLVSFFAGAWVLWLL